MSTLSFDEYSRKKGTIETVTSSNAKLPRARVEVAHPYLALMGLFCGGFAGMYSETALNIGLFGGFCGRDSGIGPAQRAKTTIWN